MKEKKRILSKKNLIKNANKITVVAMLGIAIITQGGVVFGADDPLAVINNLSTFIFSIVRAIGMILMLWGIVQIGMALKSHDPSQRASGFMTLAGAVIITFAKEILDLITGG